MAENWQYWLDYLEANSDGDAEAPVQFEEFNTCIVGVVRRAGAEDVLAYDYDECVELRMKRDQVTRADAMEHLEFNTLGTYVNKRTPVFIYTKT